MRRPGRDLSDGRNNCGRRVLHSFLGKLLAFLLAISSLSTLLGFLGLSKLNVDDSDFGASFAPPMANDWQRLTKEEVHEVDESISLARDPTKWNEIESPSPTSQVCAGDYKYF